MSRRSRKLAALTLTAAITLAGCSGHEGDDSSKKPERAEHSTSANASKGTNGGAKQRRRTLGSAKVSIGDQTWRLGITRCVSTSGRLTAQGDDGKGTIIVASFDRKSKRGSVTLSKGEDDWSAGPAGGTTLAHVRISKGSLAGSGEFAHRRLASSDAAATKGKGEKDAKGDEDGKSDEKDGAAAAVPTPAKADRSEDGTFSVSCSPKGR